MQLLAYFLIPLASAAIGWFTNYLAIKMLFHPRVAMRFMGMTIQGVFPKRQQQFAEQLGQLVADQLLSFEDIKSTLTSSENLQNLKPLIAKKIDDLLRNKVKESIPMAGLFLGDKTITKLKDTFTTEIIKQLPSLIDAYIDGVADRLDVQQIVTDRVANFDVLELENLLKGVLGREFRFIEMLGAVIGFMVGMVQLLLMTLLMVD